MVHAYVLNCVVGRDTTTALDSCAINSYLLAWIYSHWDKQAREVAFFRLHKALHHLAEREGAIDSWFSLAMNGQDEQEGLSTDFVQAIRVDLLDRKLSSERLHGVLVLFHRLAQHEVIETETEDLVYDSDVPVRWIMQALQWHLCTRPHDVNGGHILSAALEGIS